MMRTRLLLGVMGGLWAVLWTQIVPAETLTIVVENVTSAQGAVMLQVVSNQAEFDGQAPATASMMRQAASSKQGQVVFTAQDLVPGDYALRVMHDVDGNGKLDSNFIGIPQEPWAVSNNAAGRFGPPKWADAKFSVQGDVTHTVRLR